MDNVQQKQGYALALREVAAHLTAYAQVKRPVSWWPCERFREAGRQEVLGHLATFAAGLEEQAKRVPIPEAPKPDCGCGGGWLKWLRRAWK